MEKIEVLKEGGYIYIYTYICVCVCVCVCVYRHTHTLVLTSGNQRIAKNHKDYIPKMYTHFCQKDE